MRVRYFGLVLGFVLLLAPLSAASAQSLASLAAANTAATAVEKAGPGCWGCEQVGGYPVCRGGVVPGYYNCIASVLQTCQVSSPGCGGSAAVPLDPDGSTQYVSRGSLMGVTVAFHAGEPPVRRNCEGVVVARKQTSDDITTVRMRTGSLTL